MKPKANARAAGLDNPVMRTFQAIRGQPGITRLSTSNHTPATIAERLRRLAAAVAAAQPETAAAVQ